MLKGRTSGQLRISSTNLQIKKKGHRCYNIRLDWYLYKINLYPDGLLHERKKKSLSDKDKASI